MKHSFSEHIFEILMSGLPEEQLNAWERVWIWTEDTFGPNGLNLTEGGDGFGSGKNHPFFGKHHAKEHREKIALSHIGDKNPRYGKIGTMKGKIFSEEHKSNISKGKIGFHPSEETKEKQSKLMMGEKNHFYGKHHTKEAKLKQSLARLGKISVFKGKKHTEEAKIKNSRSKGGKSFICVETGEIFQTQREAADKLDLWQANIGCVLNKKLKQTERLYV